MLDLVKNSSHSKFMDLVSSSEKEIILCAPYIKLPIVKEILKNRKSDAKMKVITSASIPSFINKASDIEAIKFLLENNITVKNYQGLHAKVYIFDSEKALVTSANLTYNGLNRNFEYGVLISDDKNSVSQIVSDYKALTKSELCGAFNFENVQKIEQIILSTPKTAKIKIDRDGDEIIFQEKGKVSIPKELSQWQKDIYEAVSKLPSQTFTTKDTKQFIDELKKKHPTNNHIEEKIRQQLQQLRDIGLIKFEARGVYKRLWDEE
ncbi:MAG: phospholipase D-like domain-containing protein [Fusobacteriaceae bacterium]